MSRTKVFVSYSRKDEAWKDQVVRHMGILESWGLLHLWSDARIAIGEDWRRRIQQAMDESQVALLLVSADFLTSRFILDEEVPRLFELHEQSGMQILPVLARPCAWKLVPWLAARQLRPRGGLALSYGGEARVDRDLAALTYEVAALLRRIDGDIAAEQLAFAETLDARLPTLAGASLAPGIESGDAGVPAAALDSASRVGCGPCRHAGRRGRGRRRRGRRTPRAGDPAWGAAVQRRVLACLRLYLRPRGAPGPGPPGAPRAIRPGRAWARC
jgi:hypothetical protein